VADYLKNFFEGGEGQLFNTSGELFTFLLYKMFFF